MINDFIRNLGFVFLRRFTHHKRVEHYYLSLVCTLATRLSTSVILRLVSSFVSSERFELPSSDSYSEAFPLSYEGMLGVRWVSIPLPSVPQTDALPIELQTPYNIKDPRFRNSSLHVRCVVDPYNYFRVRLRN